LLLVHAWRRGRADALRWRRRVVRHGSHRRDRRHRPDPGGARDDSACGSSLRRRSTNAAFSEGPIIVRMVQPDSGPRPFQLMVASRGAPGGATIAEQARWAESVGFTHVAVHDHLAQRHAPLPLLTAVAMATERIGLSPLVFT